MVIQAPSGLFVALLRNCKNKHATTKPQYYHCRGLCQRPLLLCAPTGKNRDDGGECT